VSESSISLLEKLIRPASSRDSFILNPILQLCFSLVSSLVLLGVVIRLRSAFLRQQQQQQQQRGKTIAFFHPFCSDGGGGERVLWKMIQALGDFYEEGIKLNVVIYTIDPFRESYHEDIRRDVQQRFSTTYSAQLSLKFIHLDPYARLLLPSPRLSLLVESFQTMRLAFIALSVSSSIGHLPDVFVDTTGCAFTYLPASVLFGCRVVAYVHYPTISTDMLQLVWQRRRTAYTVLPSGETTEETQASSSTTEEATNEANKSRLGFVTAHAKLVYYVLFAICYGLVGSLASLVMVNSTWTYHHIRSLWRVAAWLDKIHIVFPPCQVPEDDAKSQHQTTTTTREPIILSIGQFRPEKDHALQLEATHNLRRAKKKNSTRQDVGHANFC